MLISLLKGLLIGLAVSVPVGPIGVLCIQRALYGGFKMGLMTGLGAATADALFSLIAGLGITAVTSFLDNQLFHIKICAGFLLFYMAFKLWRANFDQNQSEEKQENSAWHAYLSSCLLTLTNPLSVLAFMAIFASMGINHHNHYLELLALASAVALGSTLWWVILSGSVAFLLHHRIHKKTAHRINIISSCVMAVFASVAWISAAYPQWI